MTALSLAHLHWRSRRDPGGGPPLVTLSLLSRPLDQRTAGAIEGIGDYYASLLGKERREYDPDVPVEIAGERRLGQAIATVYGDWYRWVTRDLRDALPTEVAAALIQAGSATPVALRARLYALVNERFGGFVAGGARGQALADLAALYGIPASDAPLLDVALWLDHDEAAVLRLEGDAPAAAEVAARYNRAALAALLRNATRITCDLANPDGGLLRRLWSAGRTLGVYTDVEQGPRGLGFRLTLAGPDAVAAAPAAAGPRLALMARRLLAALGPADRLTAELLLHERPYQFRMDQRLARLPGLAGVQTEEPLDEEVEPGGPVRYDSSVEARFAAAFAALRRQARAGGWRLRREPAPLIAGKRVILPDFALLRGDLCVFVEVAGFWTPGYLAKKRAALDQLPPDTPLVLVAPEATAAAFDGLPFPVVRYRDQISAHRVLAVAEAHYGDFERRVADAGGRLTAALTDRDGWLLEEAELQTVLGCHGADEVARVLERSPLPEGWLRVPGAGLAGPRLREALRSALSEAWARGGPGARLTLAALRGLLPSVALPEDEGLVALLERMAECRVERGSLFDVQVAPPLDPDADARDTHAADAGRPVESGERDVTRDEPPPPLVYRPKAASQPRRRVAEAKRSPRASAPLFD